MQLFDGEQQPSIKFFHLRGVDFQISPKNIRSIMKQHTHDTMCDIILYQIVVNYLDGEQIVASFEEESVRDAEHENFLSKMVENNCEFV